MSDEVVELEAVDGMSHRAATRQIGITHSAALGGDPSRVHSPRNIWLQRPRQEVACYDVTQARMGVQGRFWDESGSTRQPKYNLFRDAALRHLAARARSQTISAFEPLIFFRAPLTNFGWTPRTKCNLKQFGRGIDSPYQNLKTGKGIPSPRFGAGIGNATGYSTNRIFGIFRASTR